jgi:hypothetical protein
MKARQKPKWSKVFGDLRSGVVRMKYKDRDRTVREFTGTLINAFVPQIHQLEMAANNPLEQEKIKAFDLDMIQWVTIQLESIEEYDGIISATPPPRRSNERPETDRSTEESGNEGTQEEGNARKFRSRYDPEKDKG